MPYRAEGAPDECARKNGQTELDKLGIASLRLEAWREQRE